ncbi:universal stress protein [Yoonia sp. F2084L]|uniref:universal stress protein n=1 Tax=Yoonia sp. F2084L TaxID=2926419 RepID=UPI001FF66202|nr:universal stress protein [Yoonia sp. F2084L]MCK0094371.1 universal stress protein [Yoonia sp. F2084L]
MQRFKDILVLCDEESDSRPALLRALRMAKANLAKVTLLGVVTPSPEEIDRLVASIHQGRTVTNTGQLRTYHESRLNDLAGMLRDAGVETDIMLLNGSDRSELIRHIKTANYDLLLATLNGRGAMVELLVQSNQVELLHASPCSVWLIKDTDAAAAREVLIAVDAGPQTPAQSAVNTMVTQLASSLAKIDSANLHIVNLRHALEVARLDDDAMSDVDGANIQDINTLDIEAVMEYVSGNHIDTIVVGADFGHDGPKPQEESTFQVILNQARCSVIAVKPPGPQGSVASTT